MTEPTRWPDGQQSAVVLTIDFNDIHGILTHTPAVAGRIGLLGELLDFIRSHEKVWLASAGEVAAWWQTQPDNVSEHPAEIFQRQRQEQQA